MSDLAATLSMGLQEAADICPNLAWSRPGPHCVGRVSGINYITAGERRSRADSDSRA